MACLCCDWLNTITDQSWPLWSYPDFGNSTQTRWRCKKKATAARTSKWEVWLASALKHQAVGTVVIRRLVMWAVIITSAAVLVLNSRECPESECHPTVSGTSRNDPEANTYVLQASTGIVRNHFAMHFACDPSNAPAQPASNFILFFRKHLRILLLFNTKYLYSLFLFDYPQMPTVLLF